MLKDDDSNYRLDLFGIPTSVKGVRVSIVCGYILSLIGVGTSVGNYEVGRAADRLNEIAGTHLSSAPSYALAACSTILTLTSFGLATKALLTYRAYRKKLQTDT